MSPAVQLARAVDWRTVAAVALPVWGLVAGAVIAHRPAPVGASPPAEVAFAAPPDESIPPPREIVHRTEFQPLPLVVPVIAVAEPPAPAEFGLPASEIVPQDRCQTYDTKIRFHAGMPEAATEARNSKKMLLVLHISGHFDDPGFT